MNELQVKDFWQTHPCGDMLIGGLASYKDYETFFEEYDKHRYSEHDHLLESLDNIYFKNKKTLEIGLGQGADSEQIIRRGGHWSGLDLTQESIDRVKVRLELKGLKYNGLKQGSVLEIPFKDDSFDLVFSHGVLHHVPDIAKAQNEIFRVLKPSGKLIIMLYAKYSLNYLVSISMIRRLGLLVLSCIGVNPGGIYKQYIENARTMGLFNYLKMKNFIHRNTDGPLNPYSKVYSVKEVKKDFSRFNVERWYKDFMHAPPFHVKWLSLKRYLGWHLWVEMKSIGK